MVITGALVSGIAAGLLLRREDMRHIRFGWLGFAATAAVGLTLAIIFACLFGLLPYDVPVRSWDVLMVAMGVYQSAGLFLAVLCFPWAPIRVRLKASIAVLSGAVIVGWRIYGGGDLLILPEWQEQLGNFAVGGAFAAVAVSAGAVARLAIARVMPRAV